ncbi:hypothetical protein KUTeg_019427 [Tegillarca granosa]|uniref:Sodium/hydrogen exchanger 8 n=1 Tax=Tegillarca granosa TaxID=220873 RepID=A0ABQ9EF13_TEGGR|nr:hypothetical protein KUTeg_019427 [Tegillarca granosa]
MALTPLKTAIVAVLIFHLSNFVFDGEAAVGKHTQPPPKAQHDPVTPNKELAQIFNESILYLDYTSSDPDKVCLPPREYSSDSTSYMYVSILTDIPVSSKTASIIEVNEEAFSPTMFFIVLLPPIIFESGYNLHKGNFFQNIGSIMVFAIFGTVISAAIVGGGVYLLGQAEVAYKFDMVESFAFGSLISAVDPVATLAIFHAMEVDQTLYMMVFGESILNDAVAIVLTTWCLYLYNCRTVLEYHNPATVTATGAAAFFRFVGRFCLVFFTSAFIGVVCGLLSAVLLKFIDLRKQPSLEFGMMLIFSYIPYGLAEGIHLSGIMAILFCGVVMSHYTHLNLSPVAQISTQLTFRTVAFMAETCVFAYLGLAMFSFNLNVKPAFTIWSIVSHITCLRGAIAFALSLQLEFKHEERQILVTTTLVVVLFTVLVLGGATMPIMKESLFDCYFLFKLLKAEVKKKKKRSDREVSLSKTKEMGETVDSEHLSELTEEEYEINFIKPHLKGFLKLDAKYLIPFLTRRFTQQEVREGRTQMDRLTNQWYKEVRAAPSESDSDEDEVETSLINHSGITHH